MVASYKFPQTVDDLIAEACLLKYHNKKTGEIIRNPISNKRVLATLGIDDFIDRLVRNYNSTQKNVEEYNMYLKSRYESLWDRKMIEGTIRKVKF